MIRWIWSLPLIWRLSPLHRSETPRERALCGGSVAIFALRRQTERRRRGSRWVPRDRD